jgi:uncharacterized protein YndB with AHSA1/START domain
VINRLILAPIRLAIIGWGVAWVVDRVLGARRGETPPEPVRSLVVIDAPIERVWAVLADIEGQPRWMHDLKSVRLLTPGPVGVGTRAEGTVRIFGITTADPVTITEFEPPTRFAIAHEGSFTGGGVITLEPGADGTTTIVRWDETLIAPALRHVTAVAMAPVLGSIFQADLFRLRDLVESGADASARDSEESKAGSLTGANDAGGDGPTLDDLPASTTV